MNYFDNLALAPASHRTPLVWRLPGAGSGKTVLYDGAADSVGEEARALGGGHVLLLMGRHAQKSDDGAVITQSLDRAGLTFELFCEIPPEPHYEAVLELQRATRGKRFDLVIGVGGGSVLDMAKLAAHNFSGALEEKLQSGDFSEPPLPLILLPTTAGTGSEVSPYAVLTVNGKKVFYSSPKLLPSVAIVDPLLTVSMPPRVTAATAFDAMTHAIEGAVGRPVPYTAALAVESTAQILAYLPRAAAEGTDLTARYHLAMASVMGMMAYAMGGGLYAHSISYLLTLDKDTPHGVGCGLALPFTMALNAPYISPLLDQLAARCLGRSGGVEEQREVIQKIRNLYTALPMPDSLQTLGYEEADIRVLAEKMLTQYARNANPRKLTEEDARKLFRAIYSGEICYF